jgi:hypothetical protein
MTQLRQKMLEELQRRNYSDRTAKTYVRIVRDFAAYFHSSPDKLGPEQIRQYQAYLFQSKNLHLSHKHLQAVPNPLDSLQLPPVGDIQPSRRLQKK